MKPKLISLVVGLAALFIFFVRAGAADPITPPSLTYEYVTIRWGGRDNTLVIRPNGEVEFVGGQLKNFKKPDRADERSFFMNVVMNGLAREGWELTAMTPDDYVMKRAVKK
jgi:hypothetical protein